MLKFLSAKEEIFQNTPHRKTNVAVLQLTEIKKTLCKYRVLGAKISKITLAYLSILIEIKWIWFKCL